MAESKTSRSSVILRWTTTRRAATPTLPPTGQEPPFPLQVPTGALWFWVGSGNPRSCSFLPYWSLQMAGCPRGVRGELRGALCRTVCSDRKKQLESGACGSFCVLCLTGKAGSGTLGRATTETEAHQHWLAEYPPLLHRRVSPSLVLQALALSARHCQQRRLGRPSWQEEERVARGREM